MKNNVYLTKAEVDEIIGGCLSSLNGIRIKNLPEITLNNFENAKTKDFDLKYPNPNITQFKMMIKLLKKCKELKNE